MIEVKKGGWATAELDNLRNVQINHSLLFDTDDTYDVGDPTKYVNQGFINHIYTDTLHVHGAIDDQINLANGIAPTKSTLVLGTTKNYFQDLYISKIYLNATATLDGSVAGVITGVGNLYLTGACKLGDGGTTNYTEVKADGEINLHGTARVGRHLRVGATSLQLGASSPTRGFTGTFPHLSFSQAVNQEAHFGLLVPHRWDSATDVEICVHWLYTGGQDNGTVKWGLEYASKKAGEDPTAGSVTITETTAGNHTTGELVYTCFTTKILKANLEAEDVFGLRLFRDQANDTLGTGAILLGIHFHFTQNKLGKAT